jgi:hypothetical protein
MNESNTTPEQKYKFLFESLYELCEDENWGDPGSYARSREILMACLLGHKIAPTLSGADAIDEDGECEYKSTISTSINGSYNGISVQPTWEEQVDYLTNKKIAKYKNHYIARFVRGKIVEIWKLDGMDVLNILLPKLKRGFESTKNRKDPRLGASLTQKEIYEYGEKVYEA